MEQNFCSLGEEKSASFPEKLNALEIEPSSSVWHKIQSSLNKEVIEKFPSRLYNLEIDPPAGMWQKISASIYHEVIIQKKQTQKTVLFVRYAVAASLAGAIIFAGIKFFNKNTNDNSIVKQIFQPKKKSVSDTLQEDIPQIRFEKNLSVTNSFPKEKFLAKADVFSSPQIDYPGYMTQTPDILHADANQISEANFHASDLQENISDNAASRYLLIINPDGYFVRISKKLADALGCFYKTGNSEEYKQCQEQIKKWREKIAQSPTAISTDNFMDVVDMIKSLQDKEL